MLELELVSRIQRPLAVAVEKCACSSTRPALRVRCARGRFVPRARENTTVVSFWVGLVGYQDYLHSPCPSYLTLPGSKWRQVKNLLSGVHVEQAPSRGHEASLQSVLSVQAQARRITISLSFSVAGVFSFLSSPRTSCATRRRSKKVGASSSVRCACV